MVLTEKELEGILKSLPGLGTAWVRVERLGSGSLVARVVSDVFVGLDEAARQKVVWGPLQEFTDYVAFIYTDAPGEDFSDDSGFSTFGR